MENKFRELIGISIGEASMCWSETPSGVFDSTRAKEISDKLIAAVEQLKAELAYYKNGTQIKEVHYDEPTHIIAENNKLCEQVKDYEQALELVADDHFVAEYSSEYRKTKNIAKEVLKKWGRG